MTYLAISAGKLRRYRSIQAIIDNITDMFQVLRGFFEAMHYLKKYKIKLVFCKGGYVALPVCLAAWFLQIDIAVHESDTVPGLTNKIV
ncbi:MAG: glycosyltransferase [Candidatus Peribacteria bacterium]|nr:MAG: glycosyltransferase [Candidatus Peribacteria bacterium]